MSSNEIQTERSMLVTTNSLQFVITILTNYNSFIYFPRLVFFPKNVLIAYTSAVNLLFMMQHSYW